MATVRVTVHRAQEGGYWAEVPAVPGCMTQAETVKDLLANVREALEGCLAVAEAKAGLLPTAKPTEGGT